MSQDQHFKMSHEVKNLLNGIKDKAARNIFKKSIIAAEKHYLEFKKTKQKEKTGDAAHG
jgi:hypothetical protein